MVWRPSRGLVLLYSTDAPFSIPAWGCGMDLDQGVVYRMAYGAAFALLEARNDRYPGRWCSNPAAGGDLETIMAEVVRRVANIDQVGPHLGDACGGEVKPLATRC